MRHRLLLPALAIHCLLVSPFAQGSFEDYEPNWSALNNQARYDLAHTLILQGEYSTASVELEKYLSRGGDPFSAHAMLSTTYMLAGDLARAKAHLAIAHGIDSENPDLLALEGQFEMAIGDRAKGESLLEKLVAIQPETEEARFLLVRSYLQREAVEKAKPHLMALIGSEDAENRVVAQILFAKYQAIQGRYGTALEYALAAHGQDPRNLEAVRELGMAYLHEQRYLQAKPLLEKSWSEGSRDPQLAFALGEMHYRSQDWEKAEAYWKWGHQMNPLAYPVAQRLVGLYLATGRPEKAKKIVEALNRHYQGKAESQLLEAYWSRKMGNTATAQHLLNRLDRQNHRGEIESQLRWERAQLEFAQGHHRDCESILQSLIESGEWVREATELKARIAFFHSEWDEGRRLQSEAKQLPLQWPKAGALLAGMNPGQSSDFAFRR